nr:MAG TPA: hypothetical protein [Caudoviricetes sp.]
MFSLFEDDTSDGCGLILISCHPTVLGRRTERLDVSTIPAS